MPPELLVPGAVVFTRPAGVLDMVDFSQWRRYVPGADWRHPNVPAARSRQTEPSSGRVYEDAQAYARWFGRELPTEAQWEFAARGGLNRATYSWATNTTTRWANSWAGFFPLRSWLGSALGSVASARPGSGSERTFERASTALGPQANQAGRKYICAALATAIRDVSRKPTAANRRRTSGLGGRPCRSPRPRASGRRAASGGCAASGCRACRSCHCRRGPGR